MLDNSHLLIKIKWVKKVYSMARAPPEKGPPESLTGWLFVVACMRSALYADRVRCVRRKDVFSIGVVNISLV